MEGQKPGRLPAYPHPEVSQSFMPSSRAPAWTQGIPMVTSSVESSTFGRAQHANLPLHHSAVPRMSRTTSRSTASALMMPRSLTAFAAPRARGSNAPGIAAYDRGAHGWDHIRPTQIDGRPRRLSFASHGAPSAPPRGTTLSPGNTVRQPPATAPMPSARTSTLRARLLQMREDARSASSEPATVDGLTVQTNAALTASAASVCQRKCDAFTWRTALDSSAFGRA